MLQLPQLRESLLEDSVMYVATVLVAFGIGLRLNTWIENEAYVAPLFYGAVLFLVYAKWIYASYGDA